METFKGQLVVKAQTTPVMEAEGSSRLKGTCTVYTVGKEQTIYRLTQVEDKSVVDRLSMSHLPLAEPAILDKVDLDKHLPRLEELCERSYLTSLVVANKSVLSPGALQVTVSVSKGVIAKLRIKMAQLESSNSLFQPNLSLN